MFDRLNGQFLKAVQYAEKVNWTKGLDPKTGKPIDYDPNRDVQIYNHDWKRVTDTIKNSCPDVHGGTNFWPPSYSDKTNLLYIGASEGCADITPDPSAHVRGKFGGGGYVNSERIVGSLTVVDPLTAEVKIRKDLPYPDLSGVLTTAGGIVVTAMLDGTILAFDDQTLDKLWGGQCRHRLRGAADHLRGERPAIHRDRIRHRPGRQSQDRPFAGTQDPGQRDDAVRVWVVTGSLS
jgi:alcohol dehydrogenase (cytochrome c)